MTVQQFRKKPVVIETIQFSTDPDENEGPGSVFAWLEAECPDYWYDEDTCHIVIPTLEGEMHACPGDWVIKGVRGEFYPCKPDIFDATYEAVTPCSTDSTPTTGVVRSAYVYAAHNAPIPLPPQGSKKYAAAFNRWLAERDRKTAARAWGGGETLRPIRRTLTCLWVRRERTPA